MMPQFHWMPTTNGCGFAMKVSCSVVFFACESFDWHLEQTQLGFVWFLENGLIIPQVRAIWFGSTMMINHWLLDVVCTLFSLPWNLHLESSHLVVVVVKGHAKSIEPSVVHADVPIPVLAEGFWNTNPPSVWSVLLAAKSETMASSKTGYTRKITDCILTTFPLSYGDLGAVPHFQAYIIYRIPSGSLTWQWEMPKSPLLVLICR